MFMKSTRFYLWLLAIVLAIAGCASRVAEYSEKNDFAVIAYFSGHGSEAEKYPLEKLTHVIFSFVHLQGNRLAVDNARDDSTIQRLVFLKKKYPRLKVMLALGGWGGCETCSEVFSTEKGRSEFAQSTKELLAKYRADGLDLDWEYPAIEGYPGHAYSLEDKQNFTSLVRELRNTFGDQYELSFAAVGFLDSLKIPMSKIAIGAAFYARVWANVEDKNNGLYQTGTFKDFIHYKNFESYFAASDGFQEYFDKVTEAYYRYSAKKKLFATFDNPESIKAKTKYALKNKLGGIMFWQLGGDKFDDGLLDAIDDAVEAE